MNKPTLFYIKFCLIFWLVLVDATVPPTTDFNVPKSKSVTPLTEEEMQRLGEIFRTAKLEKKPEIPGEEAEMDKLLNGIEEIKEKADSIIPEESKTPAPEIKNQAELEAEAENVEKLAKELEKEKPVEGEKGPGWREKMKGRMRRVGSVLRKLILLPFLLPVLLPALVLTAAMHPKLFALSLALGRFRTKRSIRQRMAGGMQSMYNGTKRMLGFNNNIVPDNVEAKPSVFRRAYNGIGNVGTSISNGFGRMFGRSNASAPVANQNVQI